MREIHEDAEIQSSLEAVYNRGYLVTPLDIH
jgi:hypothetical protein